MYKDELKKFYFRAGKENAITLTHYSLQDLTLNTKNCI